MRRIYYFILVAALLHLTSGMHVQANDMSLRTGLTRHWADVYLVECVERQWLDAELSTSPDGYITRAEFLKMLELAFRITPDNILLKSSLRNPAVLSYEFIDTRGHWISNEGWLKTAIDFGLVNTGDYENNMFSPDNNISRRECMMMILRALGKVHPATHYFGGPLLFEDWPGIPNWFKGYVYQMAGYHLLIGYPDKTIRQIQRATIAEAAAFIARAEDEMTRGIDMNLKIYIGDKNKGGIVSADSLVPAQKIDGWIYMSARALYEAGFRAYMIYGDLNPIWKGEKQILEFAYGALLQYQPGNIYYGIHDRLLPHWDSETAMTAQARLLYGEVMLPVYGRSGATGVAYLIASVFTDTENSLFIELDYPQILVS